MIILKEKQQLDEMSRLVVSDPSDDLPFRIVINAPDHQPPHAHVMDLKTGKAELGQFLLSKIPPRKAEDIKEYKKTITDEMRRIIFDWMGRQNGDAWKVGGRISNWQALYMEWLKNEKNSV
jgi:hypothetical protein